ASAVPLLASAGAMFLAGPGASPAGAGAGPLAGAGAGPPAGAGAGPPAGPGAGPLAGTGAGAGALTCGPLITACCFDRGHLVWPARSRGRSLARQLEHCERGIAA